MAAKKREIYARAAVQLRTHERAIKAEWLCPGAMGLYFFLLLDSRGEQTRGDVLEIVAVTSWGGKASYRAKQIEALLTVGLIRREEERLHVVKYEEHNDTPDDIAAAREAARVRKQSSRGHGHVTRDNSVRHAEVPISISCSLSGSGSLPDPDPPDRSPIRAEIAPPSHVGLTDDTPPAWWPGVLETLAMQSEPIAEPGLAWLRYRGHRKTKGLPPNREDALYWLGSVVVAEQRKARDEAARQRDRDATFAATRARPPPNPADPPAYSADELRRLEQLVPMRRRSREVA